ncbi:hypothetical protein C2S53_015423 [Perilla frutescens var. hirtella]|uniref:Uncharacterized protein n=1 Tax=Perilla frutescens var. hirtella TaxID=608512 RepID=A0AAD4IXM1_PERFH|nr:hypothetical protein C2S53_015423 [Perilla frutescens var. hirtella]
MAHVLRPFIQWPRWRHRASTFSQLLVLHSSSTRAPTSLPFFASFSIAYRHVHFRSRALKSRDVPPLSVASESGNESSDSSDGKKSRNERKREARRAVRWGMELANFSPPQIKRILRVADLEEDVFDALMVVKRLSRDVREGKRRQYNYIGRLLREVEPEIMDGLIQATKDGDQSKFHDLAGTEIDSTNVAVVTRWFDGLINKDIGITNEIYSLREVDFDRQELRQLVKKVQSALEREASLEEMAKPDAAAANAGRSLTRFLRGLANQLPVE